MSDLYGAADEAESIATIRAALEAGVTLFDTGDFYGMGHNELSVHPIPDIQIEYSLFSRGIEAGILPTCRQLGIGVSAFASSPDTTIGSRLEHGPV